MFSIPKIPAWNALHPFFIHFPIALLFTVPIIIIIGLIWVEKSRNLYISAFIIMLLGTIACYIAAVSGDAAAQVIEKSKPTIELVLNEHEDFSETARTVFTGLTLVYFIFLFVPSMMKKDLKRNISVTFNVFYLALYIISCIILLNAAHTGGILVHQLGVHAVW
jgi:uncharacterized membrane protein